MRSKIEVNEYEGYILGFIFYKFLSRTEADRIDVAFDVRPSRADEKWLNAWCSHS